MKIRFTPDGGFNVYITILLYIFMYKELCSCFAL